MNVSMNENIKELYGWGVQDIDRIIKEEFIPLLPEEYKEKLSNNLSYNPEEGGVFGAEEIFDEEDLNQIEYIKENNIEDFLVQTLGIEIDDEYFIINTVTTFEPELDEDLVSKLNPETGRDNNNRLLFINLMTDIETMFKVKYVK